MSFGGLAAVYVDSKLTVLGDDYVSRYETCVRLVQNGSGMSVASVWGESGGGSLAFGLGKPESALDAAFFHSRGMSVLDLPLREISFNTGPNASACVDLPERIDGNFTFIDSPAFGDVNFTFYVNGVLNHSATATVSHYRQSDHDYYRYNASFFWYPGACGNYNVTAVAQDDSGVIAEGSVDVTVTRACCNLVVYYPGAFCGDSLSLVVAFSKARTQSQTDGSGYFQTTDYEPTIAWGNDTYALDQPTGSPTIDMYVNGSLAASVNYTDGSGLCSFQLPLNGLASPSCFNVTVAVEESSRFQGTAVSQVFNLTRVSVLDDPAAADASTFRMIYSMSVLNGTCTTYLNASNAVETTVTAFNRSAFNVPASFVAGRLEKRVSTDASGFLNITGWSYAYLRVVSPCNFSGSTVSNPWADVNRDRRVDMKDTGLVSRLYGTGFGDARYNWTCDLNADGKIEMKDIGIISRDYGHVVNYLPNGVYSLNFDLSRWTAAASPGCPRAPHGSACRARPTWSSSLPSATRRRSPTTAATPV